MITADAWYSTDNGFASVRAMEAAHAPIVELSTSVLARGRGRLLDLGCGNGALLRRICERHPQAVPAGVERDAAKIARARTILPDFKDRLWIGDFFVSESPWSDSLEFDLVLLMPGRMLEVGEDKRSWLRSKLATCAVHLLVYAYDDWLSAHGDLVRIVDRAGLSFIERGPDRGVGLARVGS